MVGRDEAFDAVLGAVAAPPSIVLIEGEAGMGKSRLVAELLDDSRLLGRKIIEGRCQQLEDPYPFAPIIEGLRGAARLINERNLSPVAGAVAALIPELQDRLPPAPRPLEDARAERHRILRGLVEILGSVGEGVLLIEDVHWADRATEELLVQIHRARPSHLSVVLTYRTEDMRPGSPIHGWPLAGDLVQVPLLPLSDSDVRAMTAAILDVDEVSVEFARFLHERSDGIPLAVEELVRLLQDRRDLVMHSGRWVRRELESIEVPAGLRQPVLERLARLSQGARLIVEAAAVVGAPAQERFLHVVAGSSGSGPEELGEALTSGLLVESDNGIAFRHSVAMQAVGEAISGPLRRAMHQRAARALADTTPPPHATLARHFRGAEMTEEYLSHAEMAAAEALDRGDDANAATLLKDAIPMAAAGSDEQSRLALMLGKAALHGLDHTDAISLLEPIVEEPALHARIRGELNLAVAALLVQAGDGRGISRMRAALPDLQDSLELYIDALRGAAWPLSREGSLDDQLSLIREATDLVGQLGDPALEMAVRNDEAFILLYSGDPRGLRAASAIPLELSSRASERELIRSRLNFASAAFTIGRFEHALALTREGLELSRRSEYDRLRPFLETNQALLDHAMGNWKGLQGRVEALAERLSDIPHGAIDAQLVLGCLWMAKGELNRARSILEEVARAALELAALPVQAAAHGCLVRMAVACGDVDPALSLVASVEKGIRRKGIWAWVGPIAEPAVEAYLLAGSPERAEALATEIESGLAGRDAPHAQAALAACRGLLKGSDGDLDGALRCFERASSIYSSMPRPVEALAQRHRIGRILLAMGDDSGRDLLEEAVRSLDELGACWEAAAVRQTLRAHGVVLRYRGGRRGYGSDLSPREREVASLAAAQLNNREISDRLFLSVKTIEKHLTRAMRKLGISSRAELPQDLGEHAAPRP